MRFEQPRARAVAMDHNQLLHVCSTALHRAENRRRRRRQRQQQPHSPHRVRTTTRPPGVERWMPAACDVQTCVLLLCATCGPTSCSRVPRCEAVLLCADERACGGKQQSACAAEAGSASGSPCAAAVPCGARCAALPPPTTWCGMCEGTCVLCGCALVAVQCSAARLTCAPSFSLPPSPFAADELRRTGDADGISATPCAGRGALAWRVVAAGRATGGGCRWRVRASASL